MKDLPPLFWQKKNHLFSLGLWPLGYLVTLISRIRRRLLSPYISPIPVICVGNIIVGGAGKTPIVLSLVDFLIAHGFTPHILSRGYGGDIRKPTLVMPHHTGKEVGDEPLLLSKKVPTWVYKDRVKTAHFAYQAGATILLMDDGFQNPSLHKDIQLLVIDHAQKTGNGYVIPAGPLREPFKEGIARADALLLYNKDPSSPMQEFPPVFEVEIRVSSPVQKKRYIAVAGIGQPDKFFSLLEKEGGEIIHSFSFPDHYQYKREDLDPLLLLAKTHQAQLMTTEKDYVRIPASYRPFFDVLSIHAHFLEEETFYPWLLERIKAVSNAKRSSHLNF